MAAIVMVTPSQHSRGIFFKIMRFTSRTGLLPSVTKNVKIEFQEVVSFEVPKLAIPAFFTPRPFAGVYNPFPYACSILCNHPADLEAKTNVKKAKDAWTTEGKSLIETEELAALKLQQKISQQEFNLSSHQYKDDKIPEDLFRKYTETDSRPLTPAPTLISEATKASQSLRARRCVTPDPTSFIPTKEKTPLILDLRRSHSQETVFWQGCQTEDKLDASILDEASTSRTTSISSQNTSLGKRKKTPRKKSIPALGTASSIKTENSKDSESKVQTQHISASKSPSKSSLNQEHDNELHKAPEISSESSSSELEVVKRRGKKRKGKKTGKGGKEGEKEYKGIPDPGETQVSALNDSKEGSSRPSLTGEENLVENRTEEIYPATGEGKIDLNQNNKSFLDFEIMKRLQRQLDQEVVDSELNEKKKIALEEALKHKVKSKNVHQGDEMKDLKKEFLLQIINSEKWLSISRVFTRRSARFELPMDSRLLNNMTPLQYVQNYVFASPERLVLYNHVFNLYKEEPEDEEEAERILLGKNVIEGLGKIMGRPMTAEEAQEFQNLLDWKDDAGLDFRTFTGISAACERLLGPQFCSNMPTQEEDPRYEVERADFETLDGKLLRVKPDRRLVKILKSIRDL